MARGQGADSRQATIAITHVTVVDTTGGPAPTDMTVVISGDRIDQLGKSGKTTPPKESRQIDATGKFLIPGLWDMHVHANGPRRSAQQERVR